MFISTKNVKSTSLKTSKLTLDVIYTKRQTDSTNFKIVKTSKLLVYASNFAVIVNFDISFAK